MDQEFKILKWLHKLQDLLGKSKDPEGMHFSAFLHVCEALI